ncbi:MAG: hypothetical protein JJU25_18735 [Halomonas sp.]|nr:iron-sulfur cluster biosynthesis family protein [Halomonas sp.]MCC5884659.1 hypothetical protein [Halomonas sp.]
MVIEVTDKAKAWIASHGGALTVRLSPRHGCCGGGAEIVVAEARRPDDSSHYQAFDHEGLKLFIDPTLVDQGLVVGIEGLLGLKQLFVDGAPIVRQRD